MDPFVDIVKILICGCIASFVATLFFMPYTHLMHKSRCAKPDYRSTPATCTVADFPFCVLPGRRFFDRDCSRTEANLTHIAGEDVADLTKTQEEWLSGIVDNAALLLEETHRTFYMARQVRDVGRLWDSVQSRRNFSDTAAAILAGSENATLSAIKLNEEIANATAE